MAFLEIFPNNLWPLEYSILQSQLPEQDRIYSIDFRVIAVFFSFQLLAPARDPSL
jgi:hypothetical protein